MSRGVCLKVFLSAADVALKRSQRLDIEHTEPQGTNTDKDSRPTPRDRVHRAAEVE